MENFITNQSNFPNSKMLAPPKIKTYLHLHTHIHANSHIIYTILNLTLRKHIKHLTLFNIRHFELNRFEINSV